MNADGKTVETHRLTVRYNGLPAVDSVDLSVERGSVYALLGRNGAGKSSIVRCLLGFQKPDSGVARLFGRDAWLDRARLMDRVGIVPEHPDAPPEMTPAEIMRFLSKTYTRWNQAATENRLKRFRVPIDTPFGRLSKGQMRQTLLSVALASEPELLVLDDPTLGLDIVARAELFEELIVDLADRGTTVLITTHDLAGIEGIANRIGVLHESRLIIDEEVDTLKRRFRRIRLKASEADRIPFHRLRTRQTSSNVETVVTDFEEDRWASLSSELSEADSLPMSLEEIFVEVSKTEEVAV